MRTTTWAMAAMAMGSLATGLWTVACSSAADGSSSGAATAGDGGGSQSSSSGSGSGSSGSSSGSSGSSSGSSGTSSGSSGSVSDAGAPPPFDAGGPDPDLACYSQTSDSCDACCYKNHPSGSDQFDTAYYGCFCTPDKCQTQCAQTACSDAPDAGSAAPGDPCDLCIQQYAPDDGGGACGPVVAAACTSADCVAFTNCEDNCP